MSKTSQIVIMAFMVWCVIFSLFVVYAHNSRTPEIPPAQVTTTPILLDDSGTTKLVHFIKPPQVEVVSNWLSQHGGSFRYLKIDGRLALEYTRGISGSICFVPEQSIEVVPTQP